MRTISTATAAGLAAIFTPTGAVAGVDLDAIQRLRHLIVAAPRRLP